MADSADSSPAPGSSKENPGSNDPEVKASEVKVSEAQSASAKSADETPTTAAAEEKSFEALSQESSVGIVREFVDFLKYNKKWWLTPIIVVLLLVAVLIVLTTSGAAPFLYTFW